MSEPEYLTPLDQNATNPPVRFMPDELRVALEAMLHAPGDGPTVTALADRAQLTRRTCERWFTKVGLPSPRVVMVLLRLLYAHRLLLDPGASPFSWFVDPFVDLSLLGVIADSVARAAFDRATLAFLAAYAALCIAVFRVSRSPGMLIVLALAAYWSLVSGAVRAPT